MCVYAQCTIMEIGKFEIVFLSPGQNSVNRLLIYDMACVPRKHNNNNKKIRRKKTLSRTSPAKSFETLFENVAIGKHLSSADYYIIYTYIVHYLCVCVFMAEHGRRTQCNHVKCY